MQENCNRCRNKLVKNHPSGLYYLTVLVCTKTTIHLGVGGKWWIFVVTI